MAAARRRVYRHYGVNMRLDGEDELIMQVRKRGDLGERGLVWIASSSPKVHIVQSVLTGELLVLKIIPGRDYLDVSPNEVKYSTNFGAERKLPLPYKVNGEERIHFNQLLQYKWWLRDMDGNPDEDSGIYAMYFRHCNGGNLQQFARKYFEVGRPVPEHFIWHVAQRLSEVITYFNFGIFPGRDNPGPPGWRFISHRDFVSNNIFIHYHARAKGFEPSYNYVTNAFPEIVVGDFGDAAQEDEFPELITEGIYGLDEAARWEDMAFEFPPVEIGTAPDPSTGWFIDRDNMAVPVQDYIPSPDWVADHLLPLARRHVRLWRGNMEHQRLPRNYYNDLDVSWTKPEQVMPYVYEFDPRPPRAVESSKDYPDSSIDFEEEPEFVRWAEQDKIVWESADEAEETEEADAGGMMAVPPDSDGSGGSGAGGGANGGSDSGDDENDDVNGGGNDDGNEEVVNNSSGYEPTRSSTSLEPDVEALLFNANRAKMRFLHIWERVNIANLEIAELQYEPPLLQPVRRDPPPAPYIGPAEAPVPADVAAGDDNDGGLGSGSDSDASDYDGSRGTWGYT
ncbi:uncharacterized protein F4822DRAFT_441939 [Hypoxylon trugodes]|uniref:uncharacterized protein n=1 Tax=Hypoxylon trugodes TaxID=326681 RepID=UPI002198001D|nr:uncharacterized protein F4822DRAFT_441939 [Hypoxylon trugodes]KAI1390642.1 hypothetical protein F4822DRAFT_441939 [Hypoxylon trugodes]